MKKEKIGSYYLGNGKYNFTVWAPFLKKVTLKITSPEQRLLPMKKDEKGYWRLEADNVSPETRYFYKLEDTHKRPDPASFYQPEGVHKASQVVDHQSFHWEDKEWAGIPLEKMIIYELHTGTFSPEGTFEAVIQRLSELSGLGVNTIEIMPIAQFPGERNWGYDGAYPFAVQSSYGGPQGLKELVNVCHENGISVILDVVYNHLGPEGNYLADYGPYFAEKYKAPWGKAINFDDAYSDEVRNYFIQNALYWLQYYHIDALRIDAVHGIYDMGAKHILEELSAEVKRFSEEQGRKFYLIAESDLNDTRIIQKRTCGGYEIDAQWSDDFHHSVHTLLTGELNGYYTDFGKLQHLLKSFQEGFVYSWEYSAYRKRRHGSSSKDYPANQFVVSIQNHDQIGNRAWGERLSQLLSFEALKLAAGILFVSPYIPLLFMGEEYAEDSPFLYFTSHSDANLIEAVRQGRQKEFEAFAWKQDIPDPNSIDAFLKSKLKWDKQSEGKYNVMRQFYQQMIKFRKDIPALANLDKNNLKIWGIDEKKLVFLNRWHSKSKVLCIMNLSNKEVRFSTDFLETKGQKLFDSSDTKWMGNGVLLPLTIEPQQNLIIRAFSFALYEI